MAADQKLSRRKKKIMKQSDENKNNGVHVFTQNVCSLQVYHEGKYYETCVNLRGAVAEQGSDAKIFDIATKLQPYDGESLSDAIKRGFFAIISEKINNDLVTLDKLLLDVKTKPKGVDDPIHKSGFHRPIEKWEVAAYMLKPRYHTYREDYYGLSQEDKDKWHNTVYHKEF